jgi:hypothetical protein
MARPFRVIGDALNRETRRELEQEIGRHLSVVPEADPRLEALLERARQSCRAQNWMRSGVDLYRDHAIDPVIGDSRPYERYDLDNLGPVEDEYADLPEAQRRLQLTRAGTKWRCKAGDGYEWGYGGHLIIRHVPPGLDMELPRIPAEMRPDGDIPVGKLQWFYRPLELSDDPKDVPCYPSGKAQGKRIPSSRWFPRSEAAAEWMTEKEREKALKRWDEWTGRMLILEPHGDLYKAQRMTHYVFPSTPKIWVEVGEHDHEDEEFASNPRGVRKHQDEWHTCRDVRAHREGRPHKCTPRDISGRHAHWDRVKDKTKNYAKRIDMHPLAALLARDAEIVFFCIEGCIKADAILTEILRTGVKATVISVPSVTLWGPGESWHDEFPELRLVTERYLRGRHVVIVCDKDWNENHVVHDQALFCRTTLRRLSGYQEARSEALRANNALITFSVEIAAPTEGKGADDHIVELHRKAEARAELPPNALASLLVERREAPFVVDLSKKRRWDAIKRDAEALHQISLHTVRPTGTLRVSWRALERIAGFSHDRLRRSLPSLKSAGHILSEKPLETSRNVWRGSFFDRAEQFFDPSDPKPTVREIKLADGLYTESEFIPLSEWLIGCWQASESATHRRDDLALATVSTDQLDRIESEQHAARLDRPVQCEKLDHVLEVLMAFQGGETSAADWTRWLSGPKL